MNLLQSLYGLPWRGALALLMIAGTLVFALVLFPAASRKSGSSSNKIVDLQRAYTAQMFANVLRAWSATNRDAVGIMKYENIQKLDFIFPWLYALALAFGYAVLSGRREPTSLDFVLFVTPLVAALFDCIENGLHLRLLANINTHTDVEAAIRDGRFDHSLVFTASAFAYAKYLLLSVSAVGILIAGFTRLKQALG